VRAAIAILHRFCNLVQGIEPAIATCHAWSDWSACQESVVGGTVNLYDAKTNLSKLVERAAAGEEIVIAKAGKPKARLVAYRPTAEPRQPAHALGVTFIADDFDAPMPDIEAAFEGAEEAGEEGET
jgi:prevent-host-death family protein